VVAGAGFEPATFRL